MPSTPLDSGDVTRLLEASEKGSGEARDALMAVVYGELHKIAGRQMRGERADHTLSATALVNEAFIRMFKMAGMDQSEAVPWSCRSAFFRAAATAMRRILVDHARAKAAAKRGGTKPVSLDRLSLDVLEVARDASPEEIMALDDAILRLEKVDDRAASVVRLRFFAGLEYADIAAMNNLSERTVKRDWEFARAWLRDALDEAATGPAESDQDDVRAGQ